MATYTWRDDLPAELLGDGVLYGLEEDEMLTYESPEEVADQVLSECTDDPLPADWTCEVFAHRRKVVDLKFSESVADSMLECYREAWAGEYGDPDGDAVDDTNGEDGDALAAMIRSWFERSQPRQHDPTGDKIIFDAEWAKQARDDVTVGPPSKVDG